MNYPSTASPFSSLQFRYPFRKYQQMVLEVVANAKDGDHKHYIVAPPGAGKTIVGLELVRRYGRLIYTHHAEGRQILLAARSQQHGRVRQMAFELWK